MAATKRRRHKREPQQLELRITLADVVPSVWRLVRVPDAFTLDQLHRIIQLSFCWLDYHLYEFAVGDRRFQAPDSEMEGEPSTLVTLAELQLAAGSEFVYTYDFGDEWEHRIRAERLLPMPDEFGPDWTPRLIAGANAAPPEDVGGPIAYTEFVEELAGKAPSNGFSAAEILGADFDPAAFDVRVADHALTLASAWGAV